MFLESSASLEAQWLRRIGAGDPAAFADLYDRYSRPLYSFALRVVNNPKDAEDVLQEVFLKIWEKAAGFDEDIGNPFTWAVSMTRHKAIEHLRSRRRREHDFSESAVEVELPHIPVASPSDFCRDESAQMWGAVNGLPSEQRRALEMAFFGGMTHLEIAEVLQEPISTIKARIRCGMLRLRDGLATPV